MNGRIDNTAAGLRPAKVVVAVVVICIVGLNAGYVPDGVTALPVGILVGVLWRGVRTWQPGEDATYEVRMFTRPPALRWATVAVTAVIGAVFVAETADVADSGVPWWQMAAVWSVGLGVLVWYATAGPARSGRWARAGRFAHEVTEEDAALARIVPQHFATAGLTIRSPHSGIPILPTITATGLDDRGRPYYLAHVIPGHQTHDMWARVADRLASAWQVPRVVVSVEDTSAVRVTAVLREFERSGPVLWQPRPADVDVATYMGSIPMGCYDGGDDPWEQKWAEANGVVGGIPGAGKSVYLQGLVAHWCRHPHIDVAFIDLKMGAEAEAWRPRLSAVAEDQAEAVALIGWTLDECKARYIRMRAEKVRNSWKDVRRSDGQPFLGADEHVRILVVDEAAELFAGGDRESRQAADVAQQRLRSLVSLGRAAGSVVILASQKPTTDTIPGSIRDLCGVRVAYRCKADTAAAAILGADWWEASGGDPESSPLTIGEHQRGLAVVGNDAGDYVRVQTCLIDEATIDAVVAETAVWRNPWPWQGAVPDPPVEPPPPPPKPAVTPTPPPPLPTLRPGVAGQAPPTPQRPPVTPPAPPTPEPPPGEWR